MEPLRDIAHLGHVELLTPKPSESEWFFCDILGMAKVHGEGQSIYLRGFGDYAAEEFDEALLRDIAAASGCGEYYPARDAMMLVNVYLRLRHTSTGGQILLERQADISQDQTVDLGDVSVMDNQLYMRFTLSWPGSRLEPEIKDPSGVVIDGNYPGVTISQSSSIADIIISNPPSGQWNYSAFGAEVSEGQLLFNALVSSVQDPNPPTPTPTVTLSPTPIPPPPPEPQTGSFPIALIFVILAVAGVAIYAYSNTLRRGVKAAPHRGSAMLVGMSGVYQGRSIPLRPTFIIGRARTCDLPLSGERAVSRQHAMIRQAQGVWYIQDMNSRVGTYVNGRRIQAGRLSPGDQITIGNSTWIFQ